MATKLESLSTKLQSALNLANSLPDAITLDELTSPGSAATMLEGTEMLDAEGKKVTGTIETKTAADMTRSGRYVTAPAGYYPIDSTLPVVSSEAPSMNVSIDAAGKITSVTDIEAGYSDEVRYTKTLQLDTQPATTITPTKSSQTAVEAGKYTTGAVTVGAIPDEFADVSGVTATTARVASGDKFVDADGVEQTGKLSTSEVMVKDEDHITVFKIPVNGVLNVGDTSYMIVSPAESVFGGATRANVLEGKTFTSINGRAQTGTMPNNGTLSSTIDGLNTKSVSIPKGYTSGGTVALDSTIDDTADSQAVQIAEIKAMLEGKSVSGGGSAVETCTVTVTNTIAYRTPQFHCSCVNGDGLYEVKEGIFESETGSVNTYITLEDVLAGSLVIVSAASATIPAYTFTGDIEFVTCFGNSAHVFIVRSDGSIIIRDDD